MKVVGGLFCKKCFVKVRGVPVPDRLEVRFNKPSMAGLDLTDPTYSQQNLEALMFDPLNEEGVFTLHAEIDGSILATGNRVEISKIVTAFNIYGIRLDKFYVMEELEDEHHEQVLISDFMLLEEL